MRELLLLPPERNLQLSLAGAPPRNALLLSSNSGDRPRLVLAGCATLVPAYLGLRGLQ